jgi:hypothetical protein
MSLCVCGGFIISPLPIAAEEALASRAAPMLAPIQRTPTVMNAHANADDDVVAAWKRSDAFSERLLLWKEWLQRDPLFRSAGALFGVGALAAGALRDQTALTFVGTQVVCVGFDRQLNALRKHTGFSIAGSVGRRSFSVVVSRQRLTSRF